MIYLDHCATTRAYDEVIDTIAQAMREDYLNPSALYKPAKDIKRKIDEAYNYIAQTLNCQPDELIFTSGATESINMAFKGLFYKYGKRLNKIIATSSDHDSSLDTLKYLKTQGADVVLLNPDENGFIDPAELESHLDDKTLLVSILHVNNETGVIQDTENLVKLIRDKSPDAFIHLDLVQAWGRMLLNLTEMNIDLASFSAHKIHGPKNTGLLYKRTGIFPDALIHGGGQQDAWRSGTEDYPNLAGLAKAVEIQTNNFDSHKEQVKRLREILIPGLENLGAVVNFPDSIEEIVSISFPGQRAETILHMLEYEDVYVATSSACNAKSGEISHVLKAMKMNDEQARGTIRISLDASNTEEEMHETIAIFDKVITQLKDWGF